MSGKFLTTFLILLLMWFSLAGIAYQEALTGIFLATLISLIVTLKIIPKRIGSITPAGFMLLLIFIPKFIIYEIASHLKLIRIIYSPSLPIDPAIIHVPLKLKKNLQITSIATAVTMLPGTLTIDYDDKLFIHAINRHDHPIRFTHRLEKELGAAFS